MITSTVTCFDKLLYKSLIGTNRHSFGNWNMITLFFLDNVGAITLPSGSQINELFVGVTATASGFGRTGDGKKYIIITILY